MTKLKGNGSGYLFLKEHINHRGLNCLQWPQCLNPQTGYALFSLNGKMTYAHRWMCEQKHGTAPTPKHEAAHTCGNGHMGCVNPNHLIWKTKRENAQDRVRHGNYGSNKGQSRFKLTADNAAQIRLLKGKETQINLARQFGVSRQTISSIHTGVGWPSVSS